MLWLVAYIVEAKCFCYFNSGKEMAWLTAKQENLVMKLTVYLDIGWTIVTKTPMFNSMLLLNICKQYRRDKVARLETKTIINFRKKKTKMA